VPPYRVTVAPIAVAQIEAVLLSPTTENQAEMIPRAARANVIGPHPASSVSAYRMI
jgi:hypothetical protein